jgi:hypothetical protein
MAAGEVAALPAPLEAIGASIALHVDRRTGRTWPDTEHRIHTGKCRSGRAIHDVDERVPTARFRGHGVVDARAARRRDDEGAAADVGAEKLPRAMGDEA